MLFSLKTHAGIPCSGKVRWPGSIKYKGTTVTLQHHFPDFGTDKRSVNRTGCSVIIPSSSNRRGIPKFDGASPRNLNHSVPRHGIELKLWATGPSAACQATILIDGVRRNLLLKLYHDSNWTNEQSLSHSAGQLRWRRCRMEVAGSPDHDDWRRNQDE